MSSTLEHDPRVHASTERAGVGGVIAEYVRQLRQGDIGQLPVIVSLIVICVIFQIASDGIFLGSFNLVNLTFQMAAGGTIAIGVVLVLLLGEIDLSAGVVSGLGGAVMAVLTVQKGVPAGAALAISLAVGIAVGTFHGVWTTGFGIPSFIVTLAGLSEWQGAQLQVLGKTGTINLQDPTITALASTFFKGPVAYLCAALFLLYVAVGPLIARWRRQRAGLSVQPLVFLAVRSAAISVCVIVAVIVLDRDRGLNLSLLFFLGAVIVMDFILTRTRFGRMVFAIGGNAEAARRAGIPVKLVRTLVFTLASGFAGWGGMLAASRLLAANQSAGQGETLIGAIASAVIGGTSLFGGRGSVWAALLGILVIQSISNGMALLSLAFPIKLMVTGGVLLFTVTIDAVLRRNRAANAR
jgi:D-xylose transport system permease protein